MKGKQFEALAKLAMAREERKGRATMSRYGVHAVFIKGKWTPINSLPDFEGILNGGRQFVFDAKVCASRATLDLSDDKLKKRQLRHLLTRARFGAISFLLVHWPERVLKTKTVPAFTVAFPVDERMTFWAEVESGEIKSLSIQDAQELGVEVHWTDEKVSKPDLLPAICYLADLLLAWEPRQLV